MDGRTDRQTEFLSLDRVCIPCSAVKTNRCASEYVILSLRSKCMPISLSAVEACPLLARQIQSIGFTLTRTFMKLFHTGSSSTVNECQVNLGFFPAFLPAQIVIRTASFFCRSLSR